MLAANANAQANELEEREKRMEPTTTQFQQMCNSNGIALKSIQFLQTHPPQSNKQFQQPPTNGEWLITAFKENKYLHAQHPDLKMTMALLLCERNFL